MDYVDGELDTSYEDNYSEHDGMKSKSEYNLGIHMDADYGCKSLDEYGGKRAGGGRYGDYNEGSWRSWENDDDEDTY